MKHARVLFSRSSTLAIALGLVLGLAAAGTTGANTLEGPTQVVAGTDGSFSYTAVFTAGNSGALLSFWEASGGANTDFADFIADAECMFPLDPGEQIVESLEGSLIDPTLPGSVTVRFGDCSGNQLILETTILPPSVAVPALSTGALVVMTGLLLVTGAIVFRRLTT